jgi:acylphosphatase
MTYPRRAVERLEATVRGTVQGVGFRWFVVREASGLGLTGWARNEADGSVRVVAEGEAGALSALESCLRAGPPGAKVRDLEAARGPATGDFKSFRIRSGGHGGD